MALSRRWLYFIILICVLMVVYFTRKIQSNGYLTSLPDRPNNMEPEMKSELCDICTSPQILPAKVNGYICRDKICSEYLGLSDLKYYKECLMKRELIALLNKEKKSPKNGGDFEMNESLANKKGKCHFMNGTGRSAVALVSYPGSGNTWLRGLLEQVTGICTGSVYKDEKLRISGFIGEAIRTGTVLVVKVHGMHFSLHKPNKDKDLCEYGSGIFLIRNPFHATVSEWQRQKSGDNHVGVLGQEYFGNNKHWNKFVTTTINRWKIGLTKSSDMSNKLKLPIHIVRYEALQADIFGEVERILKFLNLTFQMDDVKTKLKEDFTSFKRKQKNEFEHYTENQKLMVKIIISSTLSELSDGRTFGIEEYLEY